MTDPERRTLIAEIAETLTGEDLEVLHVIAADIAIASVARSTEPPSAEPEPVADTEPAPPDLRGDQFADHVAARSDD